MWVGEAHAERAGGARGARLQHEWILLLDRLVHAALVVRRLHDQAERSLRADPEGGELTAEDGKLHGARGNDGSARTCFDRVDDIAE